MTPENDTRTEERPPRWVRRAVYGFLGIFLLCGLLSIEAYPFTGWRLYHVLRTEHRTSWDIAAVTPEGEEIIRLGELPIGLRNTSRLLGEFDGLDQRERDEICAAWAGPLRDQGRAVSGVRIYRVTTQLDPADHDRERVLAYECGAGR